MSDTAFKRGLIFFGIMFLVLMFARDHVYITDDGIWLYGETCGYWFEF